MTDCFRPDDVIDSLDGGLSAARMAHLESCAACRQLVAETRATLDVASAVNVPEPSPFFWRTVNARVGESIREAPTSTAAVLQARWSAWLQWHHVAPVAVLLALVLALGVSIRLQTGDAARAHLAESASVGIVDVASELGESPDDAVDLMSALAVLLPESDDNPLGLRPLPDFGAAAVAALSTDEQEALQILLRAAVDRPKS